MVTTQELAAAATAGLRDCSYDIGPFITLVDGPEFEETWAFRQKLLEAQIEGADLVAISRADLLENQSRARIEHVLKDVASNLIELSTVNNRGMEPILNLVAPDCWT